MWLTEGWMSVILLFFFMSLCKLLWEGRLKQQQKLAAVWTPSSGLAKAQVAVISLAGL